MNVKHIIKYSGIIVTSTGFSLSAIILVLTGWIEQLIFCAINLWCLLYITQDYDANLAEQEDKKQ